MEFWKGWRYINFTVRVRLLFYYPNFLLVKFPISQFSVNIFRKKSHKWSNTKNVRPKQYNVWYRSIPVTQLFLILSVYFFLNIYNNNNFWILCFTWIVKWTYFWNVECRFNYLKRQENLLTSWPLTKMKKTRDWPPSGCAVNDIYTLVSRGSRFFKYSNKYSNIKKRVFVTVSVDI